MKEDTLNFRSQHPWKENLLQGSLQIYRSIEWTVSHNVGLIGLVLVHSSTRRQKLKTRKPKKKGMSTGCKTNVIPQ
eukprot:1160724-Pelagomonas_calceolata.AAC.1